MKVGPYSDDMLRMLVHAEHEAAAKTPHMTTELVAHPDGPTIRVACPCGRIEEVRPTGAALVSPVELEAIRIGAVEIGRRNVVEGEERVRELEAKVRGLRVDLIAAREERDVLASYASEDAAEAAENELARRHANRHGLNRDAG